MKIGNLDLDTRFEYMIIYKDKRDGSINTCTLGKEALRVNCKQMNEDSDVKILGIYRKLNEGQFLD